MTMGDTSERNVAASHSTPAIGDVARPPSEVASSRRPPRVESQGNAAVWPTVVPFSERQRPMEESAFFNELALMFDSRQVESGIFNVERLIEKVDKDLADAIEAYKKFEAKLVVLRENAATVTNFAAKEAHLLEEMSYQGGERARLISEKIVHDSEHNLLLQERDAISEEGRRLSEELQTWKRAYPTSMI